MPSINDPRWVQNCFADSQMDCYYFGCLKKETCDKFKKLDPCGKSKKLDSKK